MNQTSVKHLFKTNRLFDRIAIDFEFLSGLIDATLCQVRVVQSSCWHSDIFDSGVSEANGWVYQHSIGVWVRYPMTGDVIYVEYALKQGLSYHRFHFEVIVHQIENAQLFVGLS